MNKIDFINEMQNKVSEIKEPNSNIELAVGVNQMIKVKLFGRGYQRLADLHNAYINIIPNWEFRTANWYKDKADKYGYTKFVFWTFMEYFGEVSTIGTSDYYDPTILINADGVYPCTIEKS